MRGRLGKALAAGLLASWLLAACTPAPETGPDSPGVLVPRGPGEAAAVVPQDQAGEHQRRPEPGAGDIEFMTMMIPHHQQAILMTDLAAEHAEADRVHAISGRIAATQSAEITAMTAWLEEFGQASAGHSAHGHTGMPGMATEAQLGALRAARGAEFDRQFLALMIHHHEGALTMAEDQLATGTEPRAVEMAQEVVTSQTDEIGHLRAILRESGG
ncbi:DUF305 domain-containing protein [Saccharomonospora sp. NPDC006951]